MQVTGVELQCVCVCVHACVRVHEGETELGGSEGRAATVHVAVHSS